jgi:dTDP-4-dehydrorhamnose reductase
MTDVDACESDPETAQAVNGDAPGALASACANRDIGLVHVSTDYVFDGESDSPYEESAEPNPLQVYGASKLDGERQVRNSDADALVVRLSFVYGVHAGSGELTGFPAWVRDRLIAGETTTLFTDQRVTPSRAGQAAETILDLLSADAEGTVHVASRSCVTPYEFGDAVRERAGADPRLIEAGSMADVDREAERPVNSCLDVTRVEELLGRSQPTLEADIDEIERTL